MSHRKILRHSLTLVLLIGCLAMPSVAAAQVAEATCAAAERWVVQNLDQIPTRYDDFVKLPLTHRKMAYSYLGAAERSHLWRAQLEAALSGELTDEQREVLLDAVQLMTPDTFAALESKRGWRYERALKTAENLEERALAAFGRETTGDLFGRLGPVGVRQVYLGDPTGEQLLAEAPLCACSQKSDWCPDGYGCWGDGENCDRVADECGTWWVYDCDGLCYRPNPTEIEITTP